MAHSNLLPNLLSMNGADWNFAEPDSATPRDRNGHGTHVAGIAVAADIGSGVVGVAPGCSLLPLRIDLSAGSYQSRADAIHFVTELARRTSNHRYVINCSWRMSGNHAGIRLAIGSAASQDILVVVCGGNDNVDTGASTFYPAAYTETVSVGATNQNDEKAQFSNYGKLIDLYAPGTSILSTYLGDQFEYLSGTSQACPVVAGVAALVWSCSPHLPAARVREVLERSCDNIDLQNPTFAGKLRNGRINASRALALAAS